MFHEDQLLFGWINLTDELFIKATDLIMKYGQEGLRTLDSIQLASASTLKNMESISITYDQLLKTFMLKEGLNVH